MPRSVETHFTEFPHSDPRVVRAPENGSVIDPNRLNIIRERHCATKAPGLLKVDDKPLLPDVDHSNELPDNIIDYRSFGQGKRKQFYMKKRVNEVLITNNTSNGLDSNVRKRNKKRTMSDEKWGEKTIRRGVELAKKGILLHE